MLRNCIKRFTLQNNYKFVSKALPSLHPKDTSITQPILTICNLSKRKFVPLSRLQKFALATPLSVVT